MGNYLMFLEDSPLYDTTLVSNEEAQDSFKECFPGGFAWEVLDVFSGRRSESSIGVDQFFK